MPRTAPAWFRLGPKPARRYFQPAEADLGEQGPHGCRGCRGSCCCSFCCCGKCCTCARLPWDDRFQLASGLGTLSELKAEARKGRFARCCARAMNEHPCSSSNSSSRVVENLFGALQPDGTCWPRPFTRADCSLDRPPCRQRQNHLHSRTRARSNHGKFTGSGGSSSSSSSSSTHARHSKSACAENRRLRHHDLFRSAEELELTPDALSQSGAVLEALMSICEEARNRRTVAGARP